LDATRVKGGLIAKQENPVVVSLLKAKAKDHIPLAGLPRLSVTQRLKLKKDHKEFLGKRKAKNDI
jgi:hypothetical protein